MRDRAPVISVMLAVQDAPVAARWYADALGAQELWNLGSVIGMTVQGAPFFLGQPEGNGWDPRPPWAPAQSGWRCSSTIRTTSSAAPSWPARTGPTTRSAT